MYEDITESGFEVFEKYHSRSVKEIFVTIQRRGNFSLNRAAFLALGSPQFVELLFNRAERLIAFRPTDSKNGRAVPVRRQSNSDSFMIAGLTFNKEYDIDTSVARRYSAEMKGKMLVVDLNSSSTDATGPRLRNESVHQTQEGLFSQLDQQTNPEKNVAKGVESEKDLTYGEDDIPTTSTENIDDAFTNVLMHLSEGQKKMILEQLSRYLDHNEKGV